MWKEVLISIYQILFWVSLGGTEISRTLQSGMSVFLPRFQPGSFRMKYVLSFQPTCSVMFCRAARTVRQVISNAVCNGTWTTAWKLGWNSGLLKCMHFVRVDMHKDLELHNIYLIGNEVFRGSIYDTARIAGKRIKRKYERSFSQRCLERPKKR